MKRFSVLFAALALTSAAHAAPSHSNKSVSRTTWNRPSLEDSTWQLGVHFGPTFNTVSWSASAFTPPETNSRTRLMVGISNEINFLNYFAFQPELNYTQRGAEVVDQPTRGDTTSVGLSYLDIPLLMKAKYYLGAGFRPFFLTGPSVGFLISKGATITQRDGRERERPSSDVNRDYSSVNFAWNFGLGTDLEISKQWALVLDTRYALGLSNILTRTGQAAPNGETDRDNSVKLSSFQLMIGIKTSML